MLRTVLCDLLGIEVPVIQAGMGMNTSAELVAAVSNAGGLGSLGAWARPVENLSQQLAAIGELTDNPFAVNHIVPDLNEEAWDLTLMAKPAVISLALGDPTELVPAAHDAGSVVIQQVTTVSQAIEAVEGGVDVVIAQGGESGGFGGTISSMPLIPQIVDAVDPVPVVAAGGITDGRGLAAALMLGAVGANLGTRFLASEEAPIHPEWKQMIVDAQSEQAVKVDVLNDIMPVPGTVGYGAVVRSLRSPFIDEWSDRREKARDDADLLGDKLLTAIKSGRLHEMLPVAGQSSGSISQILSATQIVRDIADEAERVIKASQRFI